MPDQLYGKRPPRPSSNLWILCRLDDFAARRALGALLRGYPRLTLVPLDHAHVVVVLTPGGVTGGRNGQV